jgi:ribonuclease J
MSKIEFIALGGLDEKDNKCFILTIDEEIFVINAGILVPPNAQLGVKKITPDFN